MPSYTPINGFEQLGFNEAVDTWGTESLNTTLDLIDEALDGVVDLDIGGFSGTPNPYTLTINDKAPSEGRKRVIFLRGDNTGGGVDFVINMPNKAKWWIVVKEPRARVQLKVGSTTYSMVNSNAVNIVGFKPANGTSPAAFYSLASLSGVDTVFNYITAPVVELNANILGRYTVLSPASVQQVNIALASDNVPPGMPATATIATDVTGTTTEEIIVTGIYDFAGNPLPPYKLMGMSAWVRLVSISPAEPWKLTPVASQSFTVM